MKTVFVLSLCVLVIGCMASKKKDAWAAEKIQVTLSRCYDGDTCTVQLADPHGDIPLIFKEDLSVRLSGIDTPEMRSTHCMLERCLAKHAKDALVSVVQSAEDIYLSDNVRDKYFRINSNIYYRLEGDSEYHIASDILINNSLAVEYDGGRKNQSWCNYSSEEFYSEYTQLCIENDECTTLEYEIMENHGFIKSKGQCKDLLREIASSR